MASKVASGEYKGSYILSNNDELSIAVHLNANRNPVLNQENVCDISLIGDRANLSGSVIKGAIGGAVFGTVGLAVGLGKGGKLYKVRVVWKNGKTSILELNEKDFNTLSLNF